MMRKLFLVLGLLLLAAAPALADSGFPVVSANSTNCTQITTGSTQLSGMTMGNTSTAAWVKFYDMATLPTNGALQGASPGGKPYVFPIPGNAALAGSNTFPPFTLLFTQGLAFCITGGAANNDTTAVALSQITGTIFYH